MRASVDFVWYPSPPPVPILDGVHVNTQRVNTGMVQKYGLQRKEDDMPYQNLSGYSSIKPYFDCKAASLHKY